MVYNVYKVNKGEWPRVKTGSIKHMWICPKCNTQNDDTLQCGNCGELYSPDDLLVADDEEENLSPKESKHPKSKKIIGTVISILVVVAICVASFIIVYSSIGKASESREKEQQKQEELNEINSVSYDDNYLFSGNAENAEQSEQAEQLAQEASRFSIGLKEYGEVTEENAVQYNIPRGLIVFKLKEGGIAQQLGLSYGDVITKINGNTILTAIDAKNTLSEGYGKDIFVEVSRGGKLYGLTITIDMQKQSVQEKEQ